MKIFSRTEFEQKCRQGELRHRWAQQLAGQGVEFRHTHSRWFREDVVESASPEQVADGFGWFRRTRLEARTPGEQWAAVESPADLGELAALRGLEKVEDLPEPELARMLLDLSKLGARFQGAQGPVGAYPAYNSLTGEDKGVGPIHLELKGETYPLGTRREAEVTGYVLGCGPRPQHATPRADSLRLLTAEGLSTGGNRMEHYAVPPFPDGPVFLEHYAARTFAKTPIYLGEVQLATSSLDDPKQLERLVRDRKQLYTRLEAAAGPDEAARTWAGASDLELLDHLLTRGSTRPLALLQWAEAQSPEAVRQLVARHSPDALAAAARLYEVRQCGVPTPRQLERLAQRLRGLTPDEMKNLARCSEVAAPWRVAVDGDRTWLASREVSLDGLRQPRVTFLSRDVVALEARSAGGTWRRLEASREEQLRDGWRYRSYDLSPFADGAVELRFSSATPPRSVEIRHLKVRGRDSGRGPGLVRRAIDLFAKQPVNWNDPEALFVHDLAADLSWGYGRGRDDKVAVKLQDALPPEIRPELKEHLLLFAVRGAMSTLVPDRVVFQHGEGDAIAGRLMGLASDTGGGRAENLEYLATLPGPALLSALQKRNDELEKLRQRVPLTSVLFDDSQSLAEKIQEAGDDLDGQGAQVKVTADAVVFGGVRVKRKKP